MGRPGCMFYFEWNDAMQYLTDEEFGRMFRAILDYCQFEVEPEFKSRDLLMLWGMVRNKLDADKRTYETKVAKSRKAANARWEKMLGHASAFQAWETEKETETKREIETEIETQSQPETQRDFGGVCGMPTADEVNVFSLMHGGPAFGQEFVETYTNTGWTIDGNPIRNWRGLVIKWIEDTRQEERELAG